MTDERLGSTGHRATLDFLGQITNAKVVQQGNVSQVTVCFHDILHHMQQIITILYRVAQKKLAPFFLYALTLPNINRFSKLFHFQNQEKICNNTITKDPTTPQVCRYTILAHPVGHVIAYSVTLGQI